MLVLECDAVGKPTARQFIERPLVYLDHWAWMDLADDGDRRSAFVEALKRRRGTLGFSHVNWVECADVADIDRLGRMEGLMAACMPHLFFTEFDPAEAIRRLHDPATGEDDSAVLGSNRLFRGFADMHRQSVHPLDPALFIRQLRMPKMAEAVLELRRSLERGWRGAVDRGREMMATTESGMAEVRKGITREAERLPLVVVREGATYQVLKSGMRSDDPRHARDFFHLVVPMSGCDLVVLDANGHERARQIQGELRLKETLTFESAVFCALDDAIRWLEAA